MLAVLDPRRNARVGIRHLALLTASTTLLVPASGLTSWWLALRADVVVACAHRAAARADMVALGAAVVG